MSGFMPDVVALHPETDSGLLTLEQARSAASPGNPLNTLLDWLDAYLVSPHPDLGRAGVVCPFTRPARTLGTIRVAVNACRETDEKTAVRSIRNGFAALDRIPAPHGDEHFRALITLYPNCAGPAGIAMLERAMKRYKYYSLLTLRTIGFLHANSRQEGVWNPDFRPMTAPLPMVVLRYVVQQDARFVAHHHLQWAPFVLRYGLSAAKRLLDERRNA
jgi:hypothetical protein